MKLNYINCIFTNLKITLAKLPISKKQLAYLQLNKKSTSQIYITFFSDFRVLWDARKRPRS